MSSNATRRKEQAQTIATAIKPQIRAYKTQNRKKYDAWIQAVREKELLVRNDLDMETEGG